MARRLVPGRPRSCGAYTGRGAPACIGAFGAIEQRIFPALVEGRFSLVDQWDTDGTRHVVVIDNPEKRVEPRALTSSELRIARGLLDGKSVKELAHAFVTRTEPRPRLP